jgi:hypothetical protein
MENQNKTKQKQDRMHVSNGTTSKVPSGVAQNFLTKEQLRERLNLPSTRMVDELVRKRKIPVIRLGHKTVRFDLVKVMSALERLELKAVGQK